MQKVFYLFGIIATIIIIGVGLQYGYKQYHDIQAEKLSVEQETVSVITPTIEQRLNDWNCEKQNTELYNLCLQLPEMVIRTIFTRIGTTATYEEVAEEYLRNTGYYISAQIKEKMPAITGPDAANVQDVTISTSVVRPEEPKVQVPVTIKDSIK